MRFKKAGAFVEDTEFISFGDLCHFPTFPLFLINDGLEGENTVAKQTLHNKVGY